MQILGIGRNGHIGFNEPSDALNSGTHLTNLTQDTIDANAHFFEDKSKVPTHALTMGMATIFKAKKIILLANGRSKLNAVKALFSDDITTDTPATMLKMHPDVTVICDYDAYADTRIGIDIGGMSAKVGVIENNEIIERVNVQITKEMTADNIADELISACRELILHYRAGSIGIGVPGIIKDGKLYKGSHFSAGEVSFICTAGTEKPDSGNIWGNRCGGVSLVKRVAEKKKLPCEALDGKQVFLLAGDGDKEALECLDEYTRELAIQIFNLQNILDPERFAIGGGISGQPLLMEYIRKNLDEIYSEFTYIVRRAEVVTCQYLNVSNLLGALVCYLKEEQETAH